MNLERLKKDKILKYTLTAILGLAVYASVSSIWLGIEQSFRIVFGSFYVVFLPGFVLTLVFFKKGEIDVIERVALSFTLSIAVVLLLVFYLNLIGMKTSALNIFLVVAFIIGGSVGVILWKRKK